eukprot:COSAG02_NODE_5709_length_4104_cov_1.876654_1_plen_864_part_00
MHNVGACAAVAAGAESGFASKLTVQSEGQNPSLWDGEQLQVPRGLSDQHSTQAVGYVAAKAKAAAAPGASMLRDDIHMNPILDASFRVQQGSPRLFQHDGSSHGQRNHPIHEHHQHMATSEIIGIAVKLALALGESPGRGSQQYRAQLWWCAEALLHDETYAFKPRPLALADDCGIYREDVETRKRRGAGADTWQNSGGKKGSSVWPRGDEVARFRCQYGTVKREGRPKLRFQVFTKIPPEDREHRNPTLSQRRLFIVTPQRSSEKQQQPTAALLLPWPLAISSSTTESPSAEVNSSRVDMLVSKVETSAISLVIDDSNLLSNVYELLAEVSATSTKQLVQYHRPGVLPDSLDRHVFVESGKVRRWGKAVKIDRWLNAGGKHAVREYTLKDGGVLQRRSGRIQRVSSASDTPTRAEQPEKRYHQFKVISAKTDGNRRIPESAVLFLVYTKEPSKTSTTALSKRVAPNDTSHGSRHSKTRRAVSSAAASVSLLALLGLIWGLSMHSSSFGPNPSTDDTSSCAEGLYLTTSNDEFRVDSGNQTRQCVKCTECGLHSGHESGSSIETPCTATSDTVCRPYSAIWQPLDVGVDHPSAHLPQFAATWQSSDAMYVFGGSGSAWKNNMTGTNAHAGLECYTTAIGSTDEFWKLDYDEGSRTGTWSLISGGVSSSSADNQVRPTGRAGAASWSVNKGTHGMMFSGSFDLCVVSKAPPSPPDQYVISGCNDATHCGTFDRSNSSCDGAPIFENARNGTVLLRVTDGPRSRWIVAPRVQAQTTNGDSLCDLSDHYLESTWETLSDDISNPSALPVADLYRESSAAVWWEVMPGRSHSFGLVGRDFSIIASAKRDQHPPTRAPRTCKRHTTSS